MRGVAKRGVRSRGLAPRFYFVRSLTLVAAALLASACVSVEIPLFSGGGELREHVLSGEAGPKIALIDLSGTLGINASSGLLGIQSRESAVARLREEFDRAARDEDVAAVVLRIDSPGGTVIASEILHGEVARFRRDTARPVIAQMMGIAASGGYYVAMAADRVQAYPATITGSIGVVMLGFNASGLMEKLGVGYQTFTTGTFKDAGSPFRPMTEAERTQIQSVVGDLFRGFLDVVERGRPKLSRAEIERLADAERGELVLCGDACYLRESLERMAAAIANFDEAELDRIYDEALGVYPVEQVTRGLLLPLLVHLGGRWRDLAGGIAEEHFFSMYLRSKLGARLQHRMRYAVGPRVLASCAPGEQHEIGLLLFALQAHAAGLQTVLLGADTPVDEIVIARQRSAARAVVLSSSLQPPDGFLSGDLPRLVREAGCPVFVGGDTAQSRRREIAAAGATPLCVPIDEGVRLLKAQLAKTGGVP